MNQGWFWRYGWLFSWLVLITASYLIRGPLPVDETRYMGVAWEMWLRNDFLVPYLNGEPYSHKPPVLFWLFNAGWAIFGINEWWPRLVAPLFALGGLYLTRRMATRLWPDQPQIAVLSPWILSGCIFWALFTPMTMFDMPLMAVVLLAMQGLLRAGSGQLVSGWIFVGLAAGLGILVKGPVILLHIAFPALLAPYWSETARLRPLPWYGMLAASILMAAAIALAWALPAASAGGEVYEQAILWHQTADRMVNSFAHGQPVWWYLPLLPLLLFPWLLWPTLWRALTTLFRQHDPVIRFLLVWLVPTLIAFSFISGKQPQYLLPLFPGAALLFARALSECKTVPRRGELLVPVLLMAIPGLILLLLPDLLATKLPASANGISLLWGLAIVVLVTVLLFQNWKQLNTAVVALSVTTSIIATLLLGAFFQAAAPIYDLRPAALYLSELQEKGADIAHIGKYHGQFHFLGRLKQPLASPGTLELTDWINAHPEAYIVNRHREPAAKTGPQPVYTQPYRSQWLSIWHADAIPQSFLK